MFTVIIAEKDILDGFDKYKLFLTPLLQYCDTAFCEWNRDAESFEAMVPSLVNIIAKKHDWRAVIIQSAGRHQKNPFDYTGYGECDGIIKKTDWDKMASRRYSRFECYDKAIQNPLTKLTISLCGIPSLNTVVDDRELYDSIVSGDTSIGEVMLLNRLKEMNVSELVRNLRGSSKSKVAQFVAPENQEELLQMLSERNVPAIIRMVGLDKLIRFIRIIGDDDPRFTDPEYAEYVVENTKKVELFNSLYPAFDFKNVLPSEVVCVALRTFDSEDYDTRIHWQSFNELEYSRFAEFNLYVEKLKLLAFDVQDDNHKQFEYDMIRFLSFILVLAGNEIPFGSIVKNRLYNADCENDKKALSLLLTAYDAKLHKTVVKLQEMQQEALRADARAGSSEAFMRTLESPVSIPLLLDKDVNVNALKVEYDQLGLAKDCPADEDTYFDKQYFDLRKKFQQYLKQPRRALTRATEDIRRVNEINDSEALYLNGFQLDDVEDSINEAEQNLVSTVTSNIYNTARYNKMMDEAKHAVNKGIESRMTRRVAVYSGLVALVAYFIGFIPLFITSANNTGSFSFSSLFTLIACGILSLCGLGCLFVLRHRLISCFKKFNCVMAGIVAEITSVMHQFSRYLTHACKFMRGFSAVNRMKEYEKTGVVEYKVYKKHIQDIQKACEDLRVLFSNIELSKEVDFSDMEAYDFDFTQTFDYTYAIPFEAVSSGSIEFMREGNSVEAPVGYVKAITLKREELYDV